MAEMQGSKSMDIGSDIHASLPLNHSIKTINWKKNTINSQIDNS